MLYLRHSFLNIEICYDNERNETNGKYNESNGLATDASEYISIFLSHKRLYNACFASSAVVIADTNSSELS